jgi:hypothetical protein
MRNDGRIFVERASQQFGNKIARPVIARGAKASRDED